MILIVTNHHPRDEQIIPGQHQVRIGSGVTKDVDFNCVDLHGLKAHRWLTYQQKQVAVSRPTPVESSPKATKPKKSRGSRKKAEVKQDGS